MSLQSARLGALALVWKTNFEYKLKLVEPLHRAGDESATPQMAFQTTHWSVVLAARDQKEGTVAREALASLCSTYWYPLYAYIRRTGFGPHDAEDLTQEFFYNFLRRDSLMNVSPLGGKFRSYLLGCLKHFLANQRKRQQAGRRGGGLPTIPLEGGAAETRYSLESADNATPEVLFERRWAFTVLEEALKRLGQEYGRRNQSETFEALQGFLPGSQRNVSRSEVAAKRGISASALDVAIHRLRRRFAATLRAQVAQTVSSEAEVEQEIRYLVSVLGS